MAKITVIENEYASLWYYPDKKIVHHKINKYIFGQTFYDLLLAGTDLLKKHKASKWLSDDRGIPVIRQEDLTWAMSNWIPQTVAAGWKYWAIVQPDQPIGQMVMEQVVKQYSEMGITAQFFKDPDKALAWLESL